jgi:hypothetical protein
MNSIDSFLWCLSCGTIYLFSEKTDAPDIMAVASRQHVCHLCYVAGLFGEQLRILVTGPTFIEADTILLMTTVIRYLDIAFISTL